MMIRWSTYWLIVIVILGACIRLWQLNTIPPGLHADEAMTGYTAYSLLKTGKDLSGHIKLVGFLDTNIGGTFPSLLSWLLVPFVFLFGLHPYVDRLPSALCGIASIVVLFAVTKKLTKDTTVGLCAAFLLSINPWAIHISRQGLLESLSLFLVLLGTYFFLRATTNKLHWYVWSFISFSLALYAYDAPRLFLPLFIVVLTMYQWRYVKKVKRVYFLSSLIFVCVLGTIFYRIFFLGVIGEYAHSSVINMEHIIGGVESRQILTTAPQWVARIFHNKITVGFSTVLTSVVSIFSLDWFFVNGSSNLQRAIGNHGQYYFFELPLFFIGLSYVWSRYKRVWIFLLFWMFLGALPGGLSTGNYAYRNVLLLPVPLILSAHGLQYVLGRISHIHRGMAQTILRIGITVGIGAFTLSYLFTYFYDYPVYASEWWAKEQNDAIMYAAQHKNSYTHVFLDGGSAWVTQYAFWYRVDPNEFHKQFSSSAQKRSTVEYSFDNLTFTFFDPHIKASPSATPFFPSHSLLIVPGDGRVFSHDVPVQQFYGPDGMRAVFKAIEVP